MSGYEQFMKDRVRYEEVKSAQKGVREIRKQLKKNNKTSPDSKLPMSGLVNEFSKGSKKRLTNKKILKKTSTATVDVSQPVYTEDRSRFFKESWKEDKRRLFFK